MVTVSLSVLANQANKMQTPSQSPCPARAGRHALTALHAKIDPSQPRPPGKACVASPYRVGRQHGECPRRTPRPSRAVGRACLRGPAWFQRHAVSTIGGETCVLPASVQEPVWPTTHRPREAGT
jgi:hypothetical protein